jgi:hypothetical protein
MKVEPDVEILEQRGNALLRETIDKYHGLSYEWFVTVVKLAKGARLSFEKLSKILIEVFKRKHWSQKPLDEYLYAYWLTT